ncbi:MAG: T9SS type A sorting domain-containing protein, partial [Flavobacteriales bacterium]
SLIIPKPGSNNLFYLFAVDDFHLDALQYGFTYSMVDICLDGGLGDIVVTQKNIPILDSVAEKLAGVRHANGTDYWVIVHKWQSDAFHAYQVTASGIGPAVISNVGSTHPTGMGGIGSSIGQMKISPNGQKLAIVNGNSTPSILEYFDFDAATGMVSNAVPLVPSATWMYYGVAFSPDNSKLYVGVTMNGNGVYQFDLNAGGGAPAAVLASMTQVAFNWNYLGLQLAVDGKIYVARSPFSNNPSVGVIHEPNLAGFACNYQDAAITLTGGMASYSFPSFVDSYDYSNGIAECITLGINDTQHTPQLLMNPVGDQLFVQLPSGTQLQLAVYNAAGHRVHTYPVAPLHTGYDVSGLAPGIYLALVEGDGLRSAVRFVKE